MVTVNGLPAHPLVVHAVVVLLPLAAVGTIAMALRPRWRRQLGVPVLLLAVVAVAAIPVATWTGQQLTDARGGQQSSLLALHHERAGYLLPWALAFLAALATAVVLGIVRDRAAVRAEAGPADAVAATAPRQGPLLVAVSVLAALLGVVAAGLTVWIGEAGAAAVWVGTF